MARALAINGASRVYLLGRRLDILTTAASSHPSIFVPIQCDVTSHASLQSAVDQITTQSGYINLLIANSGVGGPPVHWDPSLPLSQVRTNLFSAAAGGQAVMDETTSTLNVNVTGAFFTMVAFLELLDQGNKIAVAGKGFGKPIQEGSDVPSVQSQIIVTSSIAAFSRMAMSSPAYAAGKAAILHLTKQASSNLAVYGIRANALAPGCEYPLSPAMGLLCGCGGEGMGLMTD
jgi:NAD(P)-dependent dehydrogenase (short-subunit alcohol dehydrogenase family)